MASDTPPARAEKVRVWRTMATYTNTPTAMDGTPDMTSAENRTAWAKRLSPNSDK